METEYQDFNMVCPNAKCKYSFRLKKGERYAAPCECFKCGNIMERELSIEYFTELNVNVDVILDNPTK